MYGALVQGTRDYVDKHRFPGVVMGLSGGVDSALTLCIAVDALGADARAFGVDALALHLADEHGRRGAAGARGSASSTARSRSRACSRRRSRRSRASSPGSPPDTAEENIQSRCRGVLLMGISNKTGKMLLTTGNKSEMSVGYATLYGDMAGGFAPIKDCSKLLVYRLARWRNAQSRGDPRPGHRTAAVGGAAPRPEGHRQPAALRDPRSDPRGLHRGGSVGRPDRRARLRSGDGRPHPGSRQAQRVQAPPGAAGRARQRPRVRPRLALPDHQRLRTECGARVARRPATRSSRVPVLLRRRRPRVSRRCSWRRRRARRSRRDPSCSSSL